MRLHSPGFILDRRVRFIMLLTVAVLAVQSFALNIPVSTTTYQAQYGLSYVVTSNFTALDQGFSTVATSQLASTQPCLWVTGTNCLTVETQGHLQYSLVLNLNTPPALLTTYTITVQWSQNGGSQSLMGQLTVSVTA